MFYQSACRHGKLTHTHLHTHTYTHKKKNYQWKVSPVLIAQKKPSHVWACHYTSFPRRVLQNFIFSSSCGKTRTDSNSRPGPSSQPVTTAMCSPHVEDMSHLSVCLQSIQRRPHGKLTLLLHTVVFSLINNATSSWLRSWSVSLHFSFTLVSFHSSLLAGLASQSFGTMGWGLNILP